MMYLRHSEFGLRLVQSRQLRYYSQAKDPTQATAMPEPVLQIVLYQPEIPFNAGNVGRTCVAIGAKLWLVRPLGFQVDDRHVRRAGLDYWEHLDWEVVDDWPGLLARLPGRTYWFLTKTARRHYTEAQIRPGDVLVFGSESKGLPEADAPGTSRAVPSHSHARQGSQSEPFRGRRPGGLRGDPAMARRR